MTDSALSKAMEESWDARWLRRVTGRCAACNGPLYYPEDDGRLYCERVKMPAVVVYAAPDQEER